MKKLMVITVSASIIVSIVAIFLNYLTNDTRWLFGDIVIGFIFVLAAGIGLGANVGQGGGSIYTRRRFQEMYKNQPGKIQKLNRQSLRASLVCLSIGLPNLLLPVTVALIQHNY